MTDDTSAPLPARKGNLFQKGQSGNPSGRPKVTAEVRDIARQYMAEAIATLYDIMRNSDSDAARIVAADKILDRGHGKPAQPVDGDGDGGPIRHTIVVKPVPGRILQ